MKKANKVKYDSPFTEIRECEFQPFMTTSLGGHAGDGDDDGTITGKSNQYWDDYSDSSNAKKKGKEPKFWEFTPWMDYLW